MSRARVGVLGLLFVLGSCAGAEDSGMPPITVLTPEGGDHRWSRFSPDGSRVAYWTPGATGWDLMVAGADLSQPRRLAVHYGTLFLRPALWSPGGKQLAFLSDSLGLADVWTAEVETGALRRVTSGPGWESPLVWHPSGDRLAVLASVEGGAITTYVLALATGATAPLIADRRFAAGFWSPDGSRLAVNIFDRGVSTLWLADSAGGSLRALSSEGLESFGGEQFGTDFWSADGKQLVYTSRRTGTGDIWVIPADSGAPRQLTRDVRDDLFPSWSPDGQWVAFLSKRGRQTDVWLVPAGGGTELRVTDDAREESNLHWMPGTTRLAFETAESARGIWVLSLADGSERRITPDSLLVGDFDVSPDGSQVVYSVVRGGGVGELQIASLSGGPARTLSSAGANDTLPRWSPDGRTIAFGSNRSGNWDVWAVDAAGGEPRALTNWPTNEFGGAWSGDGSYYFVSEREASPFADLWVIPPAGGEPRRLTRNGTVFGVTAGRGTDVFVMTVGARAGQLALSRVHPEGTLQALWDKTNFAGLSQSGITPRGDSLAIKVEFTGGSWGSMLVSSRTGKGRRILEPMQMAGDFSPDGTQLLYYFGAPAQDVGVVTLANGATRRLTTSPENEVQEARWTADGKSVVFLRSVERLRLATVDVARLIQSANGK